MSIVYNQLYINGVGSSTFPFTVIVQQNPAPFKAKKKDVLNELPMGTGKALQRINAWESVPMVFKVYLDRITKEQWRRFSSWITPDGFFRSSDDPNVFYKYYSVDVTSSPLNHVDGYEVTITFDADPFAYQTTEIDGPLNHNDLFTKADDCDWFFPHIIFNKTGTTKNSFIGFRNYNTNYTKRVTFPNLPPGRYELVNVPGSENLWSLAATGTTRTGAKNYEMKGEFLDVKGRLHFRFEKSSDITIESHKIRKAWI